MRCWRPGTRLVSGQSSKVVDLEFFQLLLHRCQLCHRVTETALGVRGIFLGGLRDSGPFLNVRNVSEIVLQDMLTDGGAQTIKSHLKNLVGRDSEALGFLMDVRQEVV